MQEGIDLSEFAQITASRIEPEEWVDEETGELRVTRSRTVVQFQDETLERTLAAYGSKPFKGREEKAGEKDAAGSGPVGAGQEEKASAFNLNGTPGAIV